ncbi:hypothetical protein C4J86_5126 [Pseudomonas sp. R2-7-07]|nr:hypothetical protein C4J86_5126 [Pseudomonas sp. R2-7-07]
MNLKWKYEVTLLFSFTGFDSRCYLALPQTNVGGGLLPMAVVQLAMS